MESISAFLFILPVLLFSVVAHEFAHGYVAYRNGDPTAYQLGRLTFNPIKHIDPVWTVFLPLVMAMSGLPILAGAKPVPVNPRNYRNFKKGDIQVSLAGVTVNFILAFVLTALIPVLYGIGQLVPAASTGLAVLQSMLAQGIALNLLLVGFNLLPIPPLDGSHVFKYLLPPRWALAYARIGVIGLLLLYGLFFIGGQFLRVWLTPAFTLAYVLWNSVRDFILPLPHTFNIPLLFNFS